MVRAFCDEIPYLKATHCGSTLEDVWPCSGLRRFRRAFPTQRSLSNDQVGFVWSSERFASAPCALKRDVPSWVRLTGMNLVDVKQKGRPRPTTRTRKLKIHPTGQRTIVWRDPTLGQAAPRYLKSAVHHRCLPINKQTCNWHHRCHDETLIINFQNMTALEVYYLPKFNQQSTNHLISWISKLLINH